MKPPRLYLDTSVIGGYFDEEFKAPTRMLFAQIREGRFQGAISTIVQEELSGAPAHVRDMIVKYDLHLIQEDDEMVLLARSYLAESILSSKMLNDCRHVVAASIERVDLLVSWNFRHIVRFDRIRLFNAVNLKYGFPMIEIRSPMEVIYHE